MPFREASDDAAHCALTLLCLAIAHQHSPSREGEKEGTEEKKGGNDNLFASSFLGQITDGSEIKYDRKGKAYSTCIDVLPISTSLRAIYRGMLRAILHESVGIAQRASWSRYMSRFSPFKKITYVHHEMVLFLWLFLQDNQVRTTKMFCSSFDAVVLRSWWSSKTRTNNLSIHTDGTRTCMQQRRL